MQRRTIAFLLIALLAVAYQTPALAQAGTGTVVFRAWYCPEGYDEQFYPDVCRSIGQPATLFQDGHPVSTVTPGPDGAVFVVSPGAYTVDTGIPGDFSNQGPYTCTTTSGPNDRPGYLEAGETVECQDLLFPASGRATNPPDELDLNLTIRARRCDAPVARTAYHEQCFDKAMAGEPFRISGYQFEKQAQTDANGNVTIPIPDFELTVNPTGLNVDGPVWRFCSSATNPGVPMLYPLELTYLGSDVTCDIYFLPLIYNLAPDLSNAQTGMLEVHYRTCPVGYADANFYQDCHDFPVPSAEIDLASGDETVAVGYSNAGGNLFFLTEPGTYSFPPEILGNPEDHIAVFCSTADTPGTLLEYPVTIASGDHVVCDLYLLPS